METTEKIVESYCRYVKRWFTISHVKCSGQHEIDMLALQPEPGGSFRRYHIETSVNISDAHSKLTAKEFSPGKYKSVFLGMPIKL
jgi:hypothetical protein